MREYSDILGSVDAAFYYVERPETPMNIGALTILDGSLDFDQFVRFVESRIPLCPRYAERIVQAPLNLGQPTWIRDPEFFIENHIRRVQLENPDDPASLRILAGRLAAEPLDRSRPLWEVIMIDGLPDHTALLFKVHHCMVDGLAAIELFNFLLDVAPRPVTIGKRFVNNAPKLPNPIELLTDSFSRDLGHQFRVLQKIGTETARMLSSFTRDRDRLNMLVAAAHLISNNVKPIGKLPINGRNTGQQRLVWSDFALDDIHAIRATRKASVNDVMLTIMARTVERYIADHGGTRQPFLRALVPVNIRTSSEKSEIGNRISVLPIDIPFNMPDPLEHLAAVTSFSRVMKDSGLALSMDILLSLPAMLPAAAHAPIWGIAPIAFSLLAHTWCTNVAAAPMPVYMLGHELKQVYGFFPLNPSMGLASVIVSYNGRISLTMVADDGIVQQADMLAVYARSVFDELCRAAGVKPRPNTPPAPHPAVTESAAPPAPPTTVPPAATAPDAEIAIAPAQVAPPAVNGHLAAVSAADVSMGEDGIALPSAGAVAAAAQGEAERAGAAPDAVAALSPDVEIPAPPVVPPAPVTMPPPAPVVKPSAPPAPAAGEAHGYRLFSPEWAAAMREAINTSAAYRAASTGWTAGSLALVVGAAPRAGLPESAAVLLDLYRGSCRAARSVTPAEAMRLAAFVIEGSYDSWMEALEGRTPPLMMLTMGRLALKKGAMLRLIPFTRSASELVHCAQTVPLPR